MRERSVRGNNGLVTEDVVQDVVAQADPEHRLWSKVRYDQAGLVPVIAQQWDTREVLMMAWMNREALQATLATGQATYFSRSRQSLWVKGETSGHRQRVHSISADCDGDTLLMMVDQEGGACHTGDRTCFDAVRCEFDAAQPRLAQP